MLLGLQLRLSLQPNYTLQLVGTSCLLIPKSQRTDNRQTAAHYAINSDDDPGSLFHCRDVDVLPPAELQTTCVESDPSSRPQGAKLP